MKVLDHSPGLRTQPQARWTRRAVTIGLVNNMGDEALKVTERQFVDLVTMSAGNIDVQLRLFALERTPRSPRALEYINARYDPAGAAVEGDLDALIITGAQPRTARLSEEPYWEELIDLIDWAKEHTASTILSCLAAHSAVLHLDGLERRPLPEKCTGVFTFTAQRDHPFAAWQKRAGLIPHSRYNGLSRSDLERAGYDVLTSSPAHGVDSFTKCFGSQFVFLQGHPEYDANSLAREYRRDMGRYLRRETDQRPPRPKGYFNAEAEAELDALELRAGEEPASLPMEELSMIDALAPTEAQWRDAAISFYRNWINMIAASTLCKAANAALLTGQPRRVAREAYQET
jgi:homoserine O-succinyltransferase/O-acetyltransferase